MVQTKEIQYKNFGKCIEISNGKVSVTVTVDVGPRIIACSAPGKPNLMWNDDQLVFSQDVSSAFGEGKTWYIYGGHRMWLSPEDMPLSYYPDNEPIRYHSTASGAVFQPQKQEVTGLAETMEIVMDDSRPFFDVIHTMENGSDKPKTGAIWCLTVTDKGGMAIIPQSSDDTALLSNRLVALWPYTRLTDSRAFFGDDYITLRQDVSVKEKFKVGINNTECWMAYLNHGQMLIKTFTPEYHDGVYPDWGCDNEIFTNEHFLEVESLSPMYDMDPGQSITHTERWIVSDGVVFPNEDNSSLERFVETNIRGLL